MCPLSYHFIGFTATHALAIHNVHRAQWTAKNMDIRETSRST